MIQLGPVGKSLSKSESFSGGQNGSVGFPEGLLLIETKMNAISSLVEHPRKISCNVPPKAVGGRIRTRRGAVFSVIVLRVLSRQDLSE